MKFPRLRGGPSPFARGVRVRAASGYTLCVAMTPTAHRSGISVSPWRNSEAGSVSRIGEDGNESNATRANALDLGERNSSLRLKRDMLGNPDFFPARWVRCLRLRNVETQGHRNRNIVAGRGQRHEALTVGLLSQRATIRVCDADRVDRPFKRGSAGE